MAIRARILLIRKLLKKNKLKSFIYRERCHINSLKETKRQTEEHTDMRGAVEWQRLVDRAVRWLSCQQRTGIHRHLTRPRR